MSEITFANNEYYLNLQRQRESNARSYPRRFPMALKTASGCYVTDASNQVYLDCLGGAGTLALGHNHPEIIEILHNFLANGAPLHTLDFTSPVKNQFIDDLFSTLPKNFGERLKIQFCAPSGTDAIEAAIKLAKTVTGRTSIISFQGGYHGMSQGSLSLTGSLSPKSALGSLLPSCYFFPYPYAYRCPFGRGGEQTAELAIAYLENTLCDPESGITKPAAVIVEPIQGEGGVIEGPIEWLRALRRITSELGILLIVDEIQTGICRTGTFYALEEAGIVPDMMTLSKAIGGGLPLAVLIYKEEFDIWQPGAHAGTFRGNLMAMAAGSKTLEIIERDNVQQNVKTVGRYIKESLLSLSKIYPFIGDVRGRGLMLGIEVVNPDEPADSLRHFRPFRELASYIQKEAFRRGLILETGGRYSSVIRLLPPLIITMDDASKIITILSEIFEAFNKGGFIEL